jgi:hypothetical protein
MESQPASEQSCFTLKNKTMDKIPRKKDSVPGIASVLQIMIIIFSGTAGYGLLVYEIS